MLHWLSQPLPRTPPGHRWSHSQATAGASQGSEQALKQGSKKGKKKTGHKTKAQIAETKKEAGAMPPASFRILSRPGADAASVPASRPQPWRALKRGLRLLMT